MRGVNDMYKRILSVSKLVVIYIFLLNLTACSGDFEYRGERPELFSVAISSILGTHGFTFGSISGQIQPAVIVLEEDNYGRVMFLYYEGSHISPVSIIVMQKIEDGYAYFYPHYNFFSDSFRFLEEPPDEDSVVALKEANSWNQEMSDVDEFVRVRVSRQPERGPISDERLIEAYRIVFPEATSRPNQIIVNNPFFRTDSYGRSIYLTGGPRWEYIDDEYTRVFTNVAILFQPDYSFDLESGTLLITDRFNYQTDLRLFMEANGWDTPFNP